MEERVFNALEQLQSGDNAMMKYAEEYIMHLSQVFFKDLLQVLFTALVDGKRNEKTAMIAGVVLKRLFSWESAQRREEVNEKWLKIEEGDREKLRRKLQEGLEKCPGRIGNIVAQCMSTVARLEVVSGRWNNVFHELTEIMKKEKSDFAKKNVIETIGFLCADPSGIDAEIITYSSGHILTAIIDGTRSNNDEVALQAYSAMEKSLSFVSHNIGIENECRLIMSEIYNGCVSKNDEVSVAAMECFVSALFIYYSKVFKYIEMVFGRIAMEFLHSRKIKKIMVSMELWGVVAEHEMEAGLQLIPQIFPSLCSQIVYFLPNTTLEQTEDWTVYKAAAKLLSLLVECSPKQISEKVTFSDGSYALSQRVEQQICSTNASTIEAGLILFGSILNESTCNGLAQLFPKVVSVVAHALKMGNAVLLDTALWVFEKMFRYAYFYVEKSKETYEIIMYILDILETGTEEAVSASWALSEVVKAIRENEVSSKTGTGHIIFTNYAFILEKIMNRFLRLNRKEFTLYVALTSVICELIKTSLDKDRHAVLGVTSEIIARTKETLPERDASEEVLAAYMSILQACICTCAEKILLYVKEIIEIYLYIVENRRHTGVHTDAYLILGMLSDKIGIKFTNYLVTVMPYVIRDLKWLCEGTASEQESLTFYISLITFIGSVASSTQLGFGMYSDKIMPILIKAVGISHVPRDIKVGIIFAFADISLAVGKVFDRYFPHILRIGVSIANLEVKNDDIKFVFSLWEALLELLSCMVQGSDGKSVLIVENISTLLEIVRKITSGPVDDICMVKSLNLISDLWILYAGKNQQVIQELDAQWILDLIADQALSEKVNIREAAVTTRFQIHSAVQNYK